MYHVTTDFKLGSTVDGEDTRQNIWPVCLPKNDEEYEDRGLTDGFVVGWRDTPPVSQLDPQELGAESITLEAAR